jgi:hypothetical protein
MDNYDQTPFLIAAKRGYTAVVKLLLDTGKVDIHAKTEEEGRTPLCPTRAKLVSKYLDSDQLVFEQLFEKPYENGPFVKPDMIAPDSLWWPEVGRARYPGLLYSMKLDY